LKKLLFLLSLIYGTTFAQNGQVDSLLNALSLANHDTAKLRILDAIIEAQAQDYAAVEKYSSQMEAISKPYVDASTGELKKRYYHFYGTALNNLAYVSENKSDNEGAIRLYEQALSTFREVNDQAGEANVLTNLGFVYKRTGNLAKALDYYKESLTINTKIDNRRGMYAAENNLGLTFFALGDMKKALASYFSCLKIAEELGDKRRQGRILNNIAGVYDTQNEKARHMEYLEKSLALIVETGDKRGESFIRGNLVYKLLQTNQYEKAKDYSLRVVAIGNELGDKDILSNGFSLMSTVNRKIGKLRDAMDFEKQAYDIKRAINYKAAMVHSLNALGEMSLELNDIKNAKSYLTESLAISNEIKSPKFISVAALNLSNLNKKQGNTSKALEFYELYIKMRDSVVNEDNRKAAFKSQYKYEYEIKATADSIRGESEKAVLTAQLDQATSQRYFLTAAVILVITMASFIFYRFRTNHEMKELQLRNRIASDLHDEVGSAISSISLFAGMARLKSGKDSEEIVAKIENTSRETVDNMSDIVWSIEPANDHFDNVLKKMRYFGEQLTGSLGIGFNLVYEEGVDKTAFDMSKRKNIYLIFKEALNNAVKYSGAKDIHVMFTKEGRRYVMEIKDDGKGFDSRTSTLGNGLRNMKRRAEELGGSLEIDSTSAGTTITLKV
jgi:two-component system sensor histidine kinase UhpB